MTENLNTFIATFKRAKYFNFLFSFCFVQAFLLFKERNCKIRLRMKEVYLLATDKATSKEGQEERRKHFTKTTGSFFI